MSASVIFLSEHGRCKFFTAENVKGSSFNLEKNPCLSPQIITLGTTIADWGMLTYPNTGALMSAGRICVREVDVVDMSESVQTAASRMHHRKVGTLVVVNNENIPLGIVTDRDLTIRVLAQGLDGSVTPISQVMTTIPKTVREETTIEAALEVMRAGSFRRLPVVNDEGHLVGLLSLDDILELLAEEFRDIGMLIQEEEPTSLGRIFD